MTRACPQRQTIPELQGIRDYVGSAVEFINDETTAELDD